MLLRKPSHQPSKKQAGLQVAVRTAADCQWAWLAALEQEPKPDPMKSWSEPKEVWAHIKILQSLMALEKPLSP